MQLTKTMTGTEAVGGRAARAAIEARDLTEVYGRGENKVEAGEWVSQIGPSGPGKSTPMNMLGLLDRPTGGTYSSGATLMVVTHEAQIPRRGDGTVEIRDGEELFGDPGRG